MNKLYLYGGAALAGGALLYMLAKKRPGESMAGTVGRAAATAVGDVAVGAVKGVGAVFGIPDTDISQCDKDLAAGRTWDASFSCPASKFIGSVFSSTRINAAAASDARQIDRIIERQQRDALAPGGVYDPMGNYVGDYAPSTGGATGSW